MSVCVCVLPIDSHIVGDIEKLNIQWPLEFSWEGFYEFFFSKLWRHNDVIFSKKSHFLSYMVVQYIKSKVFSKQNFWWILFCEIPTAWRHNDVISKNTHYLRFVYVQYIKSKVFLRRIHFLIQNFRFMGLWRHNGVINNNTVFSKVFLKKWYLRPWLDFCHFFQRL